MKAREKEREGVESSSTGDIHIRINLALLGNIVVPQIKLY